MKTWWKEAVVYQIYPRSFNDTNGDGIGDLPGITAKLDYLKELGIDVIWLSPVYDSPNDDNGYDIRDYRAIMTEFGTMDDFKTMLAAAHERGIKIMMDLVVNHCSDEHAWFVSAKESNDSPYRDYFMWGKGENGQPPNNWGACFGGSAWQYNEATDDYYLHLFSPKQPDLNWENEALRQEVYDLMKSWLDLGVDGFRMDVINFISKVPTMPDGEVAEGKEYGEGSPYFMNGPKIHDYLQEMNREVLQHYNTITVGEMPGVNVEQGKLYTGSTRNELNMVFHFEIVDVGNGPLGKWTPQPWNLTDVKTIFSRWQKGLEQDGWNSLYWSNHDQPRAISRFANDSEQYRELSGKMLATCLHMMKGTPYIYQGEEIGMTNVPFANIDDYRDIETLNAYRDLVGRGVLTHDEMMRALHERSRDNARTPIQWTSAKHGGFTTGTPWINANPNYTTINAEAALANPQSIFYYYKQLIALRKQHEIVVYGAYDDVNFADERVYAYTRTLGTERLLVLCNFTADTIEFTPELEFTAREMLVHNYDDATIEQGTQTLRPYEAKVYWL